jgi:hypothetical protein
VKKFVIKKEDFYKGLSKDSYNIINWWFKIWDDNNLLDTLKNHLKSQKWGILKLWKFKISKLQECFTTYKWDIMSAMYYQICNLYYIKFNFKKLTFFNMISNYHHFQDKT